MSNLSQQTADMLIQHVVQPKVPWAEIAIGVLGLLTALVGLYAVVRKPKKGSKNARGSHRS